MIYSKDGIRRLKDTFSTDGVKTTLCDGGIILFEIFGCREIFQAVPYCDGYIVISFCNERKIKQAVVEPSKEDSCCVGCGNECCPQNTHYPF